MNVMGMQCLLACVARQDSSTITGARAPGKSAASGASDDDIPSASLGLSARLVSPAKVHMRSRQGGDPTLVGARRQARMPHGPCRF